MVHKKQFKTKVDFYWKQTVKKIGGKNRRVWVKKEAVFPDKRSKHGKIVYRYQMVRRKR